MKKYYIILLFLSIILISCNSKEEEEYKNDEVLEIVAGHDISIVDGPQYSYIILKGKYENGVYLSDMTFNNIIESTVTKRSIEYFQVDFINSNSLYNNYYHKFDSQGGKVSVYRQNFFPYHNYDNSSFINKISVLVKYSYTDTISRKGEEKYSEEIFSFKSNLNYLEEGDFIFIDNTVSNESSYRFKVGFKIDSNKYHLGHFDMQTYLEYKDGSILPFVGLYHYPTKLGDFVLGSDEKLLKTSEVSKIYYEIRHTSSDGTYAYSYYVCNIN